VGHTAGRRSPRRPRDRLHLLFAKLAPDRSQELVAKLLALGGRVNEYYAYRIADILPSHADDVRAIFARDRSVPDNDEIEKVLAAVREYL
jgi:DNA-directed RNA polymerase subunit F